MKFISTTGHERFYEYVRSFISSLENGEENCDNSSDTLPVMKEDLAIINNMFLNYRQNLHELHRLIKNYYHIEKRVRIALRQEQLLREKGRLKKSS